MSASHQFSSDPAANAPDAAAYKGKGRAEDLSMDEESEESENENEELAGDDEEEDGQSGLEPISSENIISGGRRTRGKNIDFQQAAEKTKDDEMDDDEDDEDEDFAPANDEGNEGNNNNNEDDEMRD